MSSPAPAGVAPIPSPHPRYRALLWDNDGVLVDTERWYFQATREVMAGFGVELNEALYFEHFLTRSGGAWHLIPGATEEQIETMRAERNLRYSQYLAQEPLAIAGVRETLAALRPHFAMGIVTSSRRDHFEAIHRRTGFLEFFDFAVTTDDCVECKPDPEPYLKAIARTGFTAAECLAIEDAPRGLMAAKAAGLDCWIIPTELSRPSDFSAATQILSNVTDVAKRLLE